MQRATAPLVGDTIADFALTTSDGASWRLSANVDGGWCLLVFYRGHW